jgi:stearoyl-CoA desaturase (Delta-9 desaturase)
MNEKSRSARMAPPPIAVTPAPEAVRTMKLIAGLTVVGPIFGSAIAFALAWRYGVSTWAIVLAVVMFSLTNLGVTVGFHRHFAHRTFRTSRGMRILFVILGSMAMQGTLLYWVATHLRHHQFSDTELDPHSPHFKGEHQLGYWGGLWHGHIGWMFADEVSNAARFCPDLLRDQEIFRLQQRYLTWAALGFAIPTVIGFLISGFSLYGALEGFLWGGAVRLLALHHAAWAVGSISHLHGRRPFDTRDRSTNNYLVALFSFGEGLQNNHHAFPTSARHGLRWWEPDIAGWAILLGKQGGLFWEVKHPSPAQIENKRVAAQPARG